MILLNKYSILYYSRVPSKIKAEQGLRRSFDINAQAVQTIESFGPLISQAPDVI